MSEIPEDIMKAAREAAAKVWGVGVGGEALAAEFRSGMRDDSGSVETAVAAILAERESHGWQNIDTVPKDGTIVDLWHVKGFRVVDEWWDAEDGWTGGWSEDAFTHWMKSPIANP